MSVRVVDRVDGWEQRPFSGGFDVLHDLADEEFSGVVRAGGAELYVTVGTAVAVRRGTIEDFDGASGTIFEAPDPALPLLAVMQEADPDVRAQYYTEETPISEVDRTLTDGGFTGFLELSENVLSGDYFLVYHGGNSMSVGFVGASEKLITGDEAFQTADDEVGIYKVRQADVEPLDIPEPAGASTSTEAPAAAATAEGATEASESDASEAESADEESAGGADEAATAGDEESEATGDEESEATDEETASTDEPAVAEAEADVASADATAETEPADDTATTADAGEASQTGTAAAATEASETAASESSGTRQSTSESGGDTASGASAAGTASRTSTDQSARSTSGRERSTDSGATRGSGASERGGRSAASQTGARRGGGRTPSQSAGDLETRSIPSLDPDQTHVPQRPSRQEPARNAQSSARQTQEPRDRQPAGGDAAGAEAAPGTTHGSDPAPRESAGTEAAGSADAGAGSAALSELEDELAEREAEIDRLESELADATGEREDVEADLESVREERDELSTQVERLEEEIERLEREFGAATDADQRVSPTEAIEGTNLFVEYDSKGNPTLEDAHGGSESREEVAENLRLGVHTEFDDRAVAVAGQDFGQFLQGTLHYRFAQWIVGDLLFEIRDTGHAEALPDLYDAIPEIRRVEFNGVVDVEYVEDGQEKGGRERFDVIFRHRMGDPLLVANLNDARDPATGGMMTELVTAAERVGQTEEGLSSAFLVTSSFFESEALETVSEATQGGLLSRDSRKSFVNLSRKSGYHLCLVAARDGNFHMEVPEL